jgi:hypothetical protein
MIFSSAVTTVTRTYIVPKVYDTITKGSPGLMYFLQNAKPWRTGTLYQVIFQYVDTTNGGVTGIADRLDTDRQNTRVQGSFEVKQAYKPVVVANIEQVLNQGDERILDLFATEFDTQAKSLTNVMAAQLYTGTGVGNQFDSIANAADDGTNYPTYASLSRTTYPTLDGYYLAAAGSLTLSKLATAYNAVEIGMDKPQMIMTTKSIWSTYESLLMPTVRAGYSTSGFPMMNAFGMVPTSQALQGTQGFEVIFFRGTPIVKDEQIPSGKLFLINTNYFGFKGVDLSSVEEVETLNFKNTSDGTPLGVPGRIPSTRGFNFRIMKQPVDQLAQVGYLLYAGNFISENPRLQGQMTGVS